MRFQGTIKKLDYQDDYETMIEDFMLAGAHYINAAMHKLNAVKQDKDIKHNLLYGFLKNEQALLERSNQIAELILQLEQLRPSYVYGKGENGNTARKAEQLFLEIKTLCEAILK